MKLYFLLAYLIDYGLNIVFSVKKMRIGSFATKALLTPILLVVYLTGNSSPEISVILALFCCLVGDIFLEYPHLFLPGLSAFLIGHVFYGVCFLSDFAAGTSLPWWLYLFAIIYAAYGFFICTRLSIPDMKMKTAVSIYCGIILLVSFLSLLRAGSYTQCSPWMVFAGTLLFVASDSTLAYNRFQKRTRRGGMWVMVTYGAAQLMIILGL